jgi:hypothetical protein
MKVSGLSHASQRGETFHHVRLLASLAQRREQNGDQQRDDADDYQQFHKRESAKRETITQRGANGSHMCTSRKW